MICTGPPCELCRIKASPATRAKAATAHRRSGLNTRRTTMKKQLTTLMIVLGLATAAIAQDKMKNDQMAKDKMSDGKMLDGKKTKHSKKQATKRQIQPNTSDTII